MMFSLVSCVADGIEFVQDFEIRNFLWERGCFDDCYSSNYTYNDLFRLMNNIRRILSDILGCLVDVFGNFISVSGNFMDVPGILVGALLERGLNRHE